MHTSVALTVEKKELFIVLPYLDSLSLIIRTRLQNSISKNLSFFKIKVIFKSPHVLAIVSVLKIKCLLTYALMFANARVVDTMLPIMAKHADI